MSSAKRNVFISSSSEDRNAARQLAEGLRRESLDVWTQELLVPGQNWAGEMAEALGKSDAMVVLLTPKAVESEWVRRDIEYALSSPRFEGRLIPVVLGSTDDAWLGKVPWVLKELNLVFGSSPATVSKRVADALRKAG